MAETPAQLSALRQFSEQLASVVEHAARSIVTVAARPRQPATGLIWRADTATIILTADHVIEREDAITVTLPDNRAVKAQLMGRDPRHGPAAARPPGCCPGQRECPGGNRGAAARRPSGAGVGAASRRRAGGVVWRRQCVGGPPPRLAGPRDRRRYLPGCHALS